MLLGTTNGPASQVQSVSGGWIESPAFDLTYFILSPLAGLALLLVSPSGGSSLLALAAATLIGGPHYLATYSFYFWDDTAAYQRRRWVACLVVPILIVLAVGIVAWFQIPVVIIVVIYFWNAYHVARQSCGIQSIYRHRAGVFDARLKTVTNAAIISTNLAMALSHLDWYPALHEFLTRISAYLPHLLSYGTIVAAVFSLTRLAISMSQRQRQGPPSALQSLPSWRRACCFFTPISGSATSIWLHSACCRAISSNISASSGCSIAASSPTGLGHWVSVLYRDSGVILGC